MLFSGWRGSVGGAGDGTGVAAPLFTTKEHFHHAYRRPVRAVRPATVECRRNRQRGVPRCCLRWRVGDQDGNCHHHDPSLDLDDQTGSGGVPRLPAVPVTRSSTTVAGAATTTIDPTVMAAAQQACAALRPAGGAGFGGGGGGLNGPQAAAYRTCLQQHGVTLPAAGQGTPPSSIDRTNPAFAAAAQACASLRPARGATTSTTA